MGAASANTKRAGVLNGRLKRVEVDDQRDVSVIIPIHNEEENVERLCRELKETLAATPLDYEVILVDDGSSDRTLERILQATAGDDRFTIVELRRRFGQTAALAAGVDHSRGRIIVPMDADLQNDPRDIARLIARLDEDGGYDIVSGWRKDRKDTWLTRRVPSILANQLIGRITGVRLHDFGCSLKAYRRETLESGDFFSELHRFLPALSVWQGTRVGEMVVNHRPRLHGRTKYGLCRVFKVVLDLITVKFLGGYMTRPLYFFGKLALGTFTLAVLFLAASVLQKYGFLGQPAGVKLNNNVLVLLAALLTSFSVQCILFGIVTELLVRIYHSKTDRHTYQVRRIFRQAHTSDAGPQPHSPAPFLAVEI